MYERELREADAWAEHDRLAGEYATMGFYVSGHPLAKYADRLRDLKAVELGSFESRRNNEEVAVAGIVVTIRSMRSRKGARWAILSVQDPTGMLEVLAFPESFAKLENVLKAGAMLLLRGRVQIEDAGTRLVVSDAKPIEDAVDAPISMLRVRMSRESVSDTMLDSLKTLLNAKPGICSVELGLVFPDGMELRLANFPARPRRSRPH